MVWKNIARVWINMLDEVFELWRTPTLIRKLAKDTGSEVREVSVPYHIIKYS